MNQLTRPIQMNRSVIIYYLFSGWFIMCLHFQANSQHHEGDSLILILEKNPNDTLAFEELNSLIGSLYYKDTDMAMLYSDRGLNIAKRGNNNYATGKALLNIGIVYDMQGNYDSALNNYDEALKVAIQFNLDKLKGDIYNNYSITLAILGNMEESISHALEALAIYTKINDSALIAKIYNNLGARYSEMEYFDDALDYYQKASVINENLKDNKKLAFNYGNIGLLYYDQFENKKALEYFQKSIALQDTVNDRFNFSIALHNLALVYLRMSQYEKAMENESRAYDLACKIHDELGKISTLNGIAAIHKEMGRKKEALMYFQQSEAIAEKLGARYYMIKIYEEIANLYAKLNDYENAFLYNKKYNTLKDSIMTTEKNKAIQKVNEYENKKKEQEIQLLTKDSEIQKLNLKRQKILRNSIAAVGMLILLLAMGLLHRYRYVRNTRNELSKKNKIINKEKDRSDELLLNILPAETAQELKNTGHSEARHFELATVMFTDFKGFTYMAETLTPQELVDEIDYCFKNFDQIISKHNIEKIKTIGDAYMCAGGLPVANETNPTDVVKAGLEIQAFMEKLKEEKTAANKPYFELRMGINSGPVVAGIVGIKKFQYDIWGDAVNIASRMESSGEVSKVNISQMTYEKVKDQFRCEHRGKIEAKNKGAIDMYFVESGLE